MSIETSIRSAGHRAASGGVSVLVASAGPAAGAAAPVLRGAGYEVTVAPTGAAALAALDGHPLDLVVIDWQLPDGGATGLCQRLRALPRHADRHLLVLTPADAGSAALAIRAGADDYLATPFEDVALLAKTDAGLRAARLHASESRLRAVIANVPGAIYRCANDPDWTMELISDDIERISGYPPGDFLRNARRSFASVIHPDDREQVARSVTGAIEQGRQFVLEYRIVRADGAIAWVLERGQQVHDNTGRVWLDGVIFDITERRADEERLHRSLRRLAVVEDRERIARELHDGVIQSLFGLGLALQAAGKVADRPDTVREHLTTGVSCIDTVIEDLRSYVFQLRPALLADRQLHAALELLVAEFREASGVVAVADLDTAATVALAPQAGEILQMVREALANVRRHAGATSCRVSLRRCGAAAVLEVDDDGHGFDRGAAAHGDGQGLRNLAERCAGLGGTLDIASDAGGTTLTIQVPLPS